MPELPEVETVCRNLNVIIPKNSKILNWTFWRKDLRFPIPIKKLENLKSKKLSKIYRRAKYIIFEFENSLMISHLGMTGQWRLENTVMAKFQPQKHDHVAFEFQKNQWLIYNDPRRFGFIQWVLISDKLKYFHNTGLEPVDITVDLNDINPVFKKLKTNIKSALMNQKYVVGVGNIYASEALFRAGINPLKLCPKVTEAQYQKLWIQVRDILNQAIHSGGSTIKDYRNSNDESGQFQNLFLVYGKEGHICSVCRAKNLKTKISNIKISGRATYYCKTCQR
jgi:formamidopyrimidine-DNA glycosylase